MANIITQFLIALGFDTSDLNRGEREVDRSLGSLRTSVTATGAAMSAAFIGIGKITLDTAERVNQLRLNTNTLNSSVTFVNDYGNAIRSLGGNADDAVSEITRVEDALMKLRTRGDASTFTELAYAGVDVKPLENAESGEQFMAELSKQFPQLDRQQQMSVQQTLGLSPASVELLRKGADEYRNIFQHVNDVAGLSPELVKSAQDYNAVLTETQLKWEGIKNTITEAVLPGVTSLIEKSTEFVDERVKPLIEQHPEQVQAALPGATTAAVAGTASVLGGAAAKLGVPGGGAVRGVGNAGVAIGLGQIAEETIAKPVEKKYPWLVDNPIANFLNNDPISEHFQKPGNHIDGPGWLRDTFGIGGTDAPAETVTPSAPYAPSTMSQEYNPNQSAANSTGRAVADQLRTTPIQVKSTVQNNLTVELDGRALETKIKDVTQRENQMTVDDLRSTTAR